jgi:hypothetical protein
MESQVKQNIVFENVWMKEVPKIKHQVIDIWKQTGGLDAAQAMERLNQLVYVIKNNEGNVIGMSTAFKAYIKQLRNNLYAFRCMLIPDCRIPGLTSKLVVMTRDFLESIHEQDGPEPPIGVITLVENDRIKQSRREAIWPASKMVYIGNSKEGHHIRVYYFKGARIKP